MIGEPIGEKESWAVSAYLIAITPDLQISVKEQRKQQMQTGMAQVAFQAASVVSPDSPDDPDSAVVKVPEEGNYDPEEATATL